VEQAAEVGVARTAAETPLQYAIRLRQYFKTNPEATAGEEEIEPLTSNIAKDTADLRDATNVDDLTMAFLRTRYTKQSTTALEANAIATIWQKIRKRLQMTK